MARSPKPLFEKGKSYYEGKSSHQLKYVEQNPEGYYVFKITGDSEWDEFCTKIPEDIFPNKTSYLKHLKSQEKQPLTVMPEMMDI